MSNDVIIAILSGGVFVAVIEGVREYLTWHRNRKAVREDRAAEAEEIAEKQNLIDVDARMRKVEAKVDALVESQKYVLYDRIRYLGQEYINDGEIDFDDRRVLNDMHKSYHNGLGGNGDLDILMEEVDRLPLKKKE